MLENEFTDQISLNGGWDFSLGERNKWATIQVPGCWESQGYPKQTDGPAFYRREVLIPKDWAGKKIVAQFEAVSYYCQVSLNGRMLAEHRGMWTPFEIDLTQAMRPGEINVLELAVHKPGAAFPVRSSLAGFLPDVATTFGGIWQPARLAAFQAGVDHLLIDADLETGQLRVRCQANREGLSPVQREWEVTVFQGEEQVSRRRFPLSEGGRLDALISLPSIKPWSPEEPVLYTARVDLLEQGVPIARVHRRTGFRRLSTEGDRLLLNGKPIMARGILSWGWEPDLIAPAYPPERARAEIRRAREMGFNLIKLCLFVPNPAYFDIADEEGMLLWEELPLWLPEVTPDLRSQAPIEYEEIARLSRHHPSIVLYSLGCELNRTVDKDLLEQLDGTVRGLISNVLVCDNSGSGESYGGLEFDFSDFVDYHPYFDLHYFEPLLDNWRRDWQRSRPWIFGEFCDSDTFRDIDELVTIHGGQKPWWLTADNPVTTWRPEAQAILEWHERMAAAIPDWAARDILKASYSQSMVIRKYTLEAVRRRTSMGGYIITGMRDTPISTSGVWDDLDRAKWTADDFRRINGEAVLVLDISRRRRWTFGGDRPDRMDAYNCWSGETQRWHVIYSGPRDDSPLLGWLDWVLSDLQGRPIASGRSRVERVSAGAPCEIGVIDCTLPSLPHAEELRLEVSFTGNETASNHWPIFIYPLPGQFYDQLAIVDPLRLLDDYGDWLEPIQRLDPTEGDFTSFRMLLATAWTDRLRRYVEGGGRVLLLQQGNGPLPVRRCPFWREAIHLFPAHPLWEVFPQHAYTDMQFFGLASDCAFDSPRLQQAIPQITSLRPILRRLDARAFHISDYLFEAKIGSGSLVGCSLRIQGGAGAQPFGWRRNPAGSFMLWALLELMHR